MWAVAQMNIDNNAKEWLFKTSSVAQFIELIEHDNELKTIAHKNGQQSANGVKTLDDLKELQRRLNS